MGDIPLKVMGKYECETMIVEDAQEEADALAEGWGVSPNPDVQSAAQIQAATVAEKDAEIALLRAQLAKFDGDGDGHPGGSRRGRKPKAEQAQENHDEPEAVTEAEDGDAA
ncbi:hypothetical protein IC614_03020 [Allosphingosinicella flava]|uniref:Uncharacterized protein n=1 Tax=Allosphingosinicella flava TaxID=2771430 RepID=A0A7T2GKK8_9SPHN|nr:hypothetical protein [Sphingosinicella flava]QPQ55588.1 hypothetical protein IC614_03020 [Sphingosinicella flava]